MSDLTPRPTERPEPTDDREAAGESTRGVILERFKRMQTLPPHLRSRQDEYFVQSYLRKKRFDL